VPDLHVVCDGIVIGSRLHEAVVIRGLEVMGLEPHTHIHRIGLGWKATVGRLEIVAEVFDHLDHLVW